MTTATDTQTGEQVTGTVKFGLAQIGNVTPEMANWIFRGYFILSKAVIGYMAALKYLTPVEIYNVTITITLLADPIMLGFSKLFGIDTSDQVKQPTNTNS
jgi:hypothetical protein